MAVFGRSSRFILKGTVLIVFGAALLSMFSFTYDGYKNSAVDTDELQEETEIRSRRTAGGEGEGEGDEESSPDSDDSNDDNADDSLDINNDTPADDITQAFNLGLNSWTFADYGNSKCYTKNNKARCLPGALVCGFQGAVPTLVYDLLEKHPSVYAKKDTWMNYFGRFRKMEDMRTKEFRKYLNKFKHESKAIVDSGSNTKKLICDGHDIARGYEQPEGASNPWEPDWDLPDVLQELNPDAKIILVLRKPINCIYSRFCAKYPSGDFDQELDNALAIFNAGLSTSFRHAMNIEATYESKVDIASCLFNHWVQRIYDTFDHHHIVLFEDLVNPLTRWAEIAKLLQFLELDDYPYSGMDQVNALFDAGPLCDVKSIPSGAKTKLENFLITYNDDLTSMSLLGPYNGWTYSE